MYKITKLCIATVLIVFSSITMAANEATSFIYPVGNPNIAPTEFNSPNGFRISQGFNTAPTHGGLADDGWCKNTTYGTKVNCESAGFKWIYGHTGVDLSAGGVCGGEIKATASGTVEYSGKAVIGYGNLLKLKHVLPNGRTIYSLYGHRSDTNVVNLMVGQFVAKGQIVGYVGDTDTPGACHLHFSIFDQAMPLNGAVAPVGYVYNDKTGVTSGGNSITPNIIRHFYDPLLFIDDRNAEVGMTLESVRGITP